jgi:DNA repair protein RecN (Recombination protein N)
MLVELMVENYAVVERLRVRFGAGLNLLTGETGSGKSIVVDSLGLVFGGRASADLIRAGSDRARVCGIFEAPTTRAFRQLLETNGLEAEDGELLIEREVLSSGKSRAFAGGRPVTAALLRDLAPHLGDIHGQHEQQQLFHSANQREILDTFAGAAAALEETSRVFREWRAASNELAELERGDQEKLRLADLWRFQKSEIEGARLKEGEEEQLESERRVLSNVARLQEHAAAAYDALYDAPGAALAQLKQAGRRLEEICRIDPELQPALNALAPAGVAVEEASHELRRYLGRLEADPARLDAVESRLAEIGKLKRKYGASAAEILAFLGGVSEKLAAIDNADERRARLQTAQAGLARQYEEAAARLSDTRRQAAARLEKKVQKELAELGMERCVFRVQFSETEWGEHGRDHIVFLMAANAGEEPRPIDRIASGGEISRLALALKTCAGTRPGGVARTLVFDEVDSGIGGATADAVGRRLKRLSAGEQVICVTHLAQIAGFADVHFKVEKRELKGRTVASMEELTPDARTREVGRMLSGQRVTEEALKQAEQLIRAGASL